MGEYGYIQSMSDLIKFADEWFSCEVYERYGCDKWRMEQAIFCFESNDIRFREFIALLEDLIHLPALHFTVSRGMCNYNSVRVSITEQ